MAVKYRIRIEKESSNITITYALNVPSGDAELIADFEVFVAGENVIKNFLPGQNAFQGATSYVLQKPDADAPVSFSISDNMDWSDNGNDVLRGSRKYDEALFQTAE
ncbi:MAG TPA: hypothetical protein VGI16_15840 [Candidatus Acidoferrum sp.]|jgi:hypothetical protein